MSNLYEISAKYQRLLDKDELNAEDCIELESMHDDIEDGCISMAKYIRNLNAEAEAIKQAISEMKDRMDRLLNRAESYSDVLITRMQECGLEKIIKSPLFAIRVKQNPVSVDDYDRTQIPMCYMSITTPEPIIKPNKKAIKEAIESGIDVPGAVLIRKFKLEIK